MDRAYIALGGTSSDIWIFGSKYIVSMCIVGVLALIRGRKGQKWLSKSFRRNTVLFCSIFGLCNIPWANQKLFSY